MVPFNTEHPAKALPAVWDRWEEAVQKLRRPLLVAALRGGTPLWRPGRIRPTGGASQTGVHLPGIPAALRGLSRLHATLLDLPVMRTLEPKLWPFAE